MLWYLESIDTMSGICLQIVLAPSSAKKGGGGIDEIKWGKTRWLLKWQVGSWVFFYVSLGIF